MVAVNEIVLRRVLVLALMRVLVVGVTDTSGGVIHMILTLDKLCVVL